MEDVQDRGFKMKLTDNKKIFLNVVLGILLLIVFGLIVLNLRRSESNYSDPSTRDLCTRVPNHGEVCE